MKKIILILSIVLVCASLSSAVEFAWDAYTDEANGIIFYWAESSNTSDPFLKNLPVTDIGYVIEDKFLKPNAEYSFWLTSYNEVNESAKSSIVKYTRTILAFKPPDDNLPTITYEFPGMVIIINIKPNP